MIKIERTAFLLLTSKHRKESSLYDHSHFIFVILQIYGLKTLVKSFLPHRGSHVNRKISDLLDVLSEMLQKAYAFNGHILWYEFLKSLGILHVLLLLKFTCFEVSL